MTAQTGDILKVRVGTFEEDHYSLACEPLKPYLEGMKEPIRFFPPDTGLMRGYVAEWQIDKDDRLMLIDFKGWRTNGMANGVSFLFPGETTVFAEWFTGALKINVGQVIEYKHRGYESVFENLINISITKGIATKITTNMVTL
jgi:hypothetical protein